MSCLKKYSEEDLLDLLNTNQETLAECISELEIHRSIQTGILLRGSELDRILCFPPLNLIVVRMLNPLYNWSFSVRIDIMSLLDETEYMKYMASIILDQDVGDDFPNGKGYVLALLIVLEYGFYDKLKSIYLACVREKAIAAFRLAFLDLLEMNVPYEDVLEICKSEFIERVHVS